MGGNECVSKNDENRGIYYDYLTSGKQSFNRGRFLFIKTSY